MKFKIRFAEQIVGVFVLVAVAFLALVLILIGINQRWFAKDYHFTSRFPSGDGLSVGMPIKFKGFQIGAVDRISLDENDLVDIDFSVYDTYIDKIRRNSVLELVSSPLGIGGGLVFHPGKDLGPPLAESSFIPSLNSAEGRRLVQAGLVDIPPNSDAVTRIVGEVDPILKNVNATLVSVHQLVDTLNGGLSGTADNPTGSLVRNASDMTAQINKVLVDLQSITDRLAAAANSPNGPVQGMLQPQGSMEKILNDNDALYDHIDDTLANLDATIKQLSDFVTYLNSSQPEITGILDEGRETLSQGKEVLEGIRNNPLIRGGIQPRIEQPGTSAGYRDGGF